MRRLSLILLIGTLLASILSCAKQNPSSQAAARGARELTLRKPTGCKSGAEPLSITLNRTEFENLLPMFSGVSGQSVTCDSCAGLFVAGGVDSAPWDCVVADLAHQAGLKVITSESGVQLTAGQR